ncbi:MAG: chemotaxis protein CheW [Firmicutes bacterium HGW-Firmicutes-1]|jgi:purine-binding chemotaxis protein CheW|nr:MAG: chemotaxis protein CheW [Firmicutes bacterium HGW-Firmicutes-1]
MATLQQVVFKLDKEEYGLDIMCVNGIEKYQEVVKIPNAPEYVDGIINLRGEVLPVFSLRKKFHLTDKEKDDKTKIIVAFTNNMKVGFVVDTVIEILNIDEENIEATPKILTGIDRRYIKSVAKVEDRMIILLDVELVVTDEEKISLGEVVELVE